MRQIRRQAAALLGGMSLLAAIALACGCAKQETLARLDPTEARAAWAAFPTNYVAELEERLGTDKFATLTYLGQKYRMCEQRFFAVPKSFGRSGDMDFEMFDLACFLTSMGIQIQSRRPHPDSVEIFHIVLTLKPDHHPARGALAFNHRLSGRLELSKQEATRALADFDKQAAAADPEVAKMMETYGKRDPEVASWIKANAESRNDLVRLSEGNDLR